MCVYFYDTWFLFLVYFFCITTWFHMHPKHIFIASAFRVGFFLPHTCRPSIIPVRYNEPPSTRITNCSSWCISDSCRIFLDHSHGYTRLGRGDCSLVSDTFRILVKSRIYFCFPRVFVTVQNMHNERSVLEKGEIKKALILS